MVRVVTERLVQELTTELEVRRTQLCGQLIGLRQGRRRHQQLARQVAELGCSNPSPSPDPNPNPNPNPNPSPNPTPKVAELDFAFELGEEMREQEEVTHTYPYP